MSSPQKFNRVSMGPCLNFVNSMVSRVGSGVYDYVPFFVLLSCGVWPSVWRGARAAPAPGALPAAGARRPGGRGRARAPPRGRRGLCCIGQTAGLQLVTHALETDTHAHTSHTFTQPPARSGDNCDSAKRSNEADAPLRPS